MIGDGPQAGRWAPIVFQKERLLRAVKIVGHADNRDRQKLRAIRLPTKESHARVSVKELGGAVQGDVIVCSFRVHGQGRCYGIRSVTARDDQIFANGFMDVLPAVQLGNIDAVFLCEFRRAKIDAMLVLVFLGLLHDVHLDRIRRESLLDQLGGALHRLLGNRIFIRVRHDNLMLRVSPGADNKIACIQRA